MKVTKSKKRLLRASPRNVKAMLPFCIDESHRLFGSDPSLFNAIRMVDPGSSRSRMIATQAIFRRNSGKRVRWMGSASWANGDSLKPAPKKFVPAQVLRRQTQS